MKSTVKISWVAIGLLAAVFVMAPVQSEGQILKRITQKVTEKVESEANKRAEKKIDEAVTKGFDKVEEAAANSVKSSAGTGMPSMESILAGMGGSEVVLNESYNYTVGVTYKISTPQTNSDTEMTMWFSDHQGIAIQANDAGNRMTTVIDGEQLIMFMDQEKQYLAIGPGMMEKMGGMIGGEIEEPEPEEAENYKVTQLSDERLLGYLCKVYLVEGPEVESKVWLTEQLDASIVGSFGNQLGSLTKNTQYKLPPEAKMLQGIMLKTESRDKASNETTLMEATNVNENGLTIRSADYKPIGG